MASWRAVPGFEGLYSVSSDGKVRSLRSGIELKSAPYKGGYERVTFSVDGVRSNHPVHVLVLSAFSGARQDGAETRHLNGIPNDNRSVNLRWGTHAENMQDKIDHGNNHNVNKEKCIRGHDLVAPNLVPSQDRVGKRKCLACSRAQNFAYYRGIPVSQKIADRYYTSILKERA